MAGLEPMANPERVDRIRSALRSNHFDLLVCALPMNVLLLSGYCPVVGTSVAIASSDGRVSLLVPEDEEALAKQSWADEVRTFQPGSLDKLITAAEAIQEPLRLLAGSFTPHTVRIGYEAREVSEPVTYSAIHLYGGTVAILLRGAFSNPALASADDILPELRARKTELEVSRIRAACEIAGQAFKQGVSGIRTGATEVETAAAFRQPLSASLIEHPDLQRADGFVWCMSGANSALASGAYARSRAKRIEPGDLVLVHCNSYADGYWTDITRTYCAGEGDDRQRRIHEAVLEARKAALASIARGVKASVVDLAAREVLRERGFGSEFKHGTGHGVGFGAISASDKPRIHPKSNDVLETGMVFNVEPAVYFDGYGGVRHCDMVAVTSQGCELLTPFQCGIEDLFLRH